MLKLNRRDFLLYLAPVSAASTLLLTEKAFSQSKSIQLQAPKQNQSFALGEQIRLSVLLRTQYPRLLRVDFRANGQLIGSGNWRNPNLLWTPTQSGNFTITAEAISQQGNIIAQSSVSVRVLNVLYDTLGGPGNWGSTGQIALPSYFLTEYEISSYQVCTQFIGTLSSPKILRRLELAAIYSANNQNLDWNQFSACFLKIWDSNFYSAPTTPSINYASLPGINFGDTTTPIGTANGLQVFHIGWDGLNINLPANASLEISIQKGISINSNDNFRILASSFPGQVTKTATKFLNGPPTTGSYPQPMAVKILVD